jgi:hypothetical protein
MNFMSLGKEGKKKKTKTSSNVTYTALETVNFSDVIFVYISFFILNASH